MQFVSSDLEWNEYHVKKQKSSDTILLQTQKMALAQQTYKNAKNGSKIIISINLSFVRRGVAVTSLGVSTKLLYVGPG